LVEARELSSFPYYPGNLHSLLIIVFQQTPPTPSTETLTRIQILTAMGVTAVVLLLVSRLWLFFDPTEMLPMKWAGGRSPLIGIALGLGITVASAIAYRVWAAYRQSADFYLAMVITPLTWMDLIWLGLLPGMSEELLFRGVMLPAIGLTWFGILISSACFGVMHFSGSQHGAYIIWATIIGAVLGYSAVATGSLLVPIAAHITTNLVSACLWKLDTSR
jgi:uncharacterized protein